LSDIVLGGTVTSVGAVALALGALWMLRLASTLFVPLPYGIDRLMPDLARRVSRVSRWLVGLLAAMIMVSAALTAIAAWGLVDLNRWLSDPDLQLVFWRIVSAILLAATLALLWAAIASFVDQRLRGAALLDNNRARTLLGLFRNAFTIFVSVLGTMVVLSQLGIDIAPLLAGAGVIGLAIGFGAQKLVQDIITGVFIQLENAINEGDVVGVAGITGGVEKLSIRSVRLRTLDGAVHIVPFSSVDTVTNLTRDFSYHLAELGVAYKEKVPAVIAAMQAAFDTLRAGPFGADIIDDFEMHGVTALGDSSVTVRGRIKTRPGKQWALGREYTALVKDEFDNRGIEIPFPHRQLMLPDGFIQAMARRPGDEARVIDGATGEGQPDQVPDKT
jgi:small conductance mechanosensitive channel